ncbi:MAG: type II and III secretion system protein family protein, partial [Hyphomonadaceae bacterium]
MITTLRHFRSAVKTVLAAACILGSAQTAAAWMERQTPIDAPVLAIENGRSTVVETTEAFATIAVADPDIADVMATSDRSFFVRGKSPGWTTVLVYNAEGGIQDMIEVRVALALDSLRRDLSVILPGEDVEVYAVLDGVFIEGLVENPNAAERAIRLAERHVPGGVANGLTVRQSQQVLLEVRFVEASREVVKEIGIGNNISSGTFDVATAGDLISGFAANTIGAVTQVGSEAIDISLQALEEKGVIRTLAEPNLVALSGDTASFLAGGEFPVPVASDQGNITIEYRQFGVGLSFTPTVLGDGLINMRVRPEVSALDTRNSVSTGGVEVPGLTVRRADTTVELRDGQAFAIAGLLQNSYSNDVRQTPWLAS